jgi:hypothetical protein
VPAEHSVSGFVNLKEHSMKFVNQLVSAAAISLLAFSAFAMPSTPGTKEDAQALAAKAAAHVKKVGFEQAVKDFTADQATWGLVSRDRLVYVYAYDYNGVALAHSVNGAVVGKVSSAALIVRVECRAGLPTRERAARR